MSTDQRSPTDDKRILGIEDIIAEHRATTIGASPAVDADGKLRPMTPEQLATYQARARAWLDSLTQCEDAATQSEEFKRFARAIDEHRGGPPVFGREYY